MSRHAGRVGGKGGGAGGGIICGEGPIGEQPGDNLRRDGDQRRCGGYHKKRRKQNRLRQRGPRALMIGGAELR